MSRDKPSVSVVITTKDRPKYLMECLLAVSRQTFKDFEVIVVDNGERKAREILASIPLKIRYFPVPPKYGGAFCKNIGIMAARGEFVALLDDDEIPLPFWLQELVEKQREGDYDVVLGRRRNLILCEAEWLTEKVKRWAAHPLGFMHPLVKKNSFEKIGYYDPMLCKATRWRGVLGEDVDWLYRAKLGGAKIGVVHRILAYHRSGATKFRIRRLITWNAYGGGVALRIFSLREGLFLKRLPSIVLRLVYAVPRSIIARLRGKHGDSIYHILSFFHALGFLIGPETSFEKRSKTGKQRSIAS